MTAIYDDHFMTLDCNRETSTLRLIWKPTTRELGPEGFQLALALFAAETVARRVRSVLVDVREFHAHDAPPKVEDWRQDVIIPLYSRSSITRFAYLLPAGAPAKPVREAAGGERYDTGFFNAEADAVSWLAQA